MLSTKPKSSLESGRRPLLLWLSLAIALATAAVYWQTGRNTFVNFDDPDYVKNNPMTQAGLTAETVHWAFTTFQASNWHPVTWLSHALDCQLFGMNLGAHHLVSLGFHIVDAVLLLFLLARMTGAVWRSAMVAALFALHPLHVESVAWIAERKDVLSMLFFLLSLWSYTTYTAATAGSTPPSTARRGLAYGLALVWFALGLLSKPMLVTLPCVLLLLDFWPLRRLNRPAAFGRLLLEKLPFFALSAASSAITFLVQRSGGAVVSLANSSFETRAANALAAYGRYLAKTIYPVDLAAFYPYEPVDFSSGNAVLAGLLVVIISIGALVYARSRPGEFVGWYWFVGTLVPVIGLVQVGRQSMADRYTYLPHIGLFILVVWAVADILRRFKVGWFPQAILAAAVLLPCAYLTEKQVPVWRDSRTLFSHAARVTRNNFIAHGVLANSLMEEGKYEEALAENELSLKLNPGYPEAHATRGHLFAKRKEYEKAVACYQEALRLDATYGDAYTGMADALVQQNKSVEAENAAREALRLSPLSLPAYYTLATALHQQRKYAEAVEVYRKLIALNPSLFSPHRYLANAYFAMGKTEEAVASLKQALALQPANQETRLALGMMLLELGRLDEAGEALQEVLRAEPNHAMAAYQWALILQSKKDFTGAASFFRRAIAAQPEWPEALNNLAWLLAACSKAEIRDGAQAVPLAEKAVKITKESQPLFLGTLAAAFAEAGRFEDACRAAEKARDLAEGQGSRDLAKRNAELLELYRAHKAYHEPE